MKRKSTRKDLERKLFEAILELQTPRECQQFFADLCTPSEVEDFADRWHIATMLVDEIPYREISEKTGVSTTTVGRVARSLHHGSDGYKIILKKLGKIS